MSVIERLARKKDKSLEISAPHSYTLHGVEIHKLSVAEYVEFLRMADSLPELIFGTAFPECDNVADVIDKLAGLDKKAVLQLTGRLLTTVPTEFCRLLSSLLGIDEKRLLDVNCDNPLTLNELLEIIVAFAKENDYSDFFTSVQLLKQIFSRTVSPTQENTGCSVG